MKIININVCHNKTSSLVFTIIKNRITYLEFEFVIEINAIFYIVNKNKSNKNPTGHHNTTL